jgi:hypothetical protein
MKNCLALVALRYRVLALFGAVRLRFLECARLTPLIDGSAEGTGC